MKRFLNFTLISLAVLLPATAFAAAKTFKEFILQLVGLLDLATVLLFSAAILVFFWSIVSKLWKYDSGNAENKKELQTVLLWGIIIIFVMVSLWGIIGILQQTLSGGLG